mmetsp:Transcript_88640/g.237009  ORF Transcript_88640/g.237009 Transcript_88640/m.237009 type:complete len:338 (+) Transcript_88640:79-1092(+)
MGFFLSTPQSPLPPPAVLSQTVTPREAWDTWEQGPRCARCPQCYCRLCPARPSQTARLWRVPVGDVEAGPFGGASLVCRRCGGKTAAAVEATPLGDGGDVLVDLSAAACPIQFQPLCVTIAGLYPAWIESASMLLRQAPGANRCMVQSEITLKRSSLGKPSDKELPTGPVDLLVVVHKVAGARTPLTDECGLYTKYLRQAWDRAGLVVLVLLDAPFEHVQRLLEEQPTLRSLLRAGRFLPILQCSGSATPSSSPQKPAADSKGVGPNAVPPAGDTHPPSSPSSAGALQDPYWSSFLDACMDGGMPRCPQVPPPERGELPSEAELIAHIRQLSSTAEL